MNKIHMVVIFIVGVLIALIGLQVMAPVTQNLQTPLYDTPTGSIDMEVMVEESVDEITEWSDIGDGAIGLDTSTYSIYTAQTRQISSTYYPLTPSYFTLTDYFNSDFYDETGINYEITLHITSVFNYSYDSSAPLRIRFIAVDENHQLVRMNTVSFAPEELAPQGQPQDLTATFELSPSYLFEDAVYFYVNEGFKSDVDIPDKTIENLNEPSISITHTVFQEGTTFGHTFGSSLVFIIPLVFASAIIVYGVSYIRKQQS